MKRYLTAFFTFLGYVAFIFVMGAGIVLYIGHRKSQAAEAAVMTNQDGQVVAMSPEKQADTLTTEVHTLPHFQPISRKPVSATKTKPVRQQYTSKTAPAVSAKPVAHTATVSAQPTAKMSAKPTAAKAKPKAAKPRPASTTHTDLGMPEAPLRTYRATDRTASPRTGGSRIPDVTAPPSELEKQAIRHAENIRQLEEETAKLRNPPVEQTALMKLFSGGKK